MKINYTITRFEGDFAILEDSDLQETEIERDILYDGANEGDRVLFDGLQYTFDEAATLAAQKRIEDLFRSNIAINHYTITRFEGDRAFLAMDRDDEDFEIFGGSEISIERDELLYEGAKVGDRVLSGFDGFTLRRD